MSETPEAITYNEALRTVTRQQTVLDGLRTRTGTLFAAATLVTAFLGGQALTREPKLDVLAWLAIGAFVALFLLALSILWPWNFRFVLSPTILIEDHLQKTASELQLYLAQIWEKNYDLNQKRVDQLHWAFRVACTCLSLEVIAWLIRLGKG